MCTECEKYEFVSSKGSFTKEHGATYSTERICCCKDFTKNGKEGDQSYGKIYDVTEKNKQLQKYTARWKQCFQILILYVLWLKKNGLNSLSVAAC